MQPVREIVFKVSVQLAAALGLAGVLALCVYLATHVSDPVAARGGQFAPSGTSSVTGQARVIDGDTLDVAGVRVRLEGIDAPETDQTCEREPTFWKMRGATWKCGVEAMGHLERLVRDRTVTCQSRGVDVYGRLIGQCVVAGLDVNADLVRNGLAWAFVKYSQRYVEIEAEARAAKRGIFQGASTPAWEWRARRWQAAAEQRREDNGQECLIKGNVTRYGNIYHMPWDRWYQKTRIEIDRGERWFCNEKEALMAGWRPASAR